jgi:hypothetical protein
MQGNSKTVRAKNHTLASASLACLERCRIRSRTAPAPPAAAVMPGTLIWRETGVASSAIFPQATSYSPRRSTSAQIWD